MKQAEIFPSLSPEVLFNRVCWDLQGEEGACSSCLEEEIRHSPLNKELTGPGSAQQRLVPRRRA